MTVYKWVTLPITRIMTTKRISYAIRSKVITFYNKKYINLFKKNSFSWVYTTELSDNEIIIKV